MNHFTNAGQLLVGFAFGIAIALVVFRVLLQLVRANFYNPICQFIYKATNPLLQPLQRIVPSWRGLNLAGLLLAWLLCVLKTWLLFAMGSGQPALAGLLLLGLADLLRFVLMVYSALIIVRVVLSFINVDARHPVIPLVYQLTTPILDPIARRLPDFGGIDLSPLVAWLLIALLRALLVYPLLDIGMRLST